MIPNCDRELADEALALVRYSEGSTAFKQAGHFLTLADAIQIIHSRKANDHLDSIASQLQDIRIEVNAIQQLANSTGRIEDVTYAVNNLAEAVREGH